LFVGAAVAILIQQQLVGGNVYIYKAITFIMLILMFAAYQQCSEVEFAQETYSENSLNNINDVLRKAEPVMAVRASGCITCHANVNSGYVTDFAYGSPYFLGGDTFSFTSGSTYGNHQDSWRTARFGGVVIVPATGDHMINGKVQSLARYIEDEEARKDLGGRAPVVEKNVVYIGAPTAATLLNRFKADNSVTIKTIRNSIQSVAFSGIEQQASGYYKNVREIECDGDVLVNGVLLLDNPVIKTLQGCRIYSTSSIFLQGEITYVNLSTDGTDKTNLQLVSSRAISMGVGTTYCGPEDARFGAGGNPLRERLVNIWTTPGQFTREAVANGRTPAQEGATILADAGRLPGGPRDATCFAKGRETHLERLFVNAPQVQSRYRGNFRGVIVAEIALASLGAFVFEFDPVFKDVNVLPLLKNEDFFYIK
jgi:hypothetical protein